nr:MAG TPA: hypothetical protein [Caudoviricetes sp.]
MSVVYEMCTLIAVDIECLVHSILSFKLILINYLTKILILMYKLKYNLVFSYYNIPNLYLTNTNK